MMISRRSLAAAAALLLAACGDGGGTGPVVPPILTVSVSTTGRALDRDGYTLRMDGDSVGRVGVDGTFTVPNPREGAHSLVLDGVRHNCSVEGGVWRAVELRSGVPVNVSLKVACAPSDMAFVARINGNGPYGLFVRRGNSEPQLLVTSVTPARVTWSPDGHKIAYAVPFGFAGGTQMEYIDVDSMKRVVVPYNGSSTHPEWSPDGRRLVFTGSPQANVGSTPPDVWTVGLDGSNPVLLTPGLDRREMMPTWSPDGSRISYLGWAGDPRSQELWTMNPDGSDARLLTTVVSGGYNTIAWTRDGSRIVFSEVTQPSGLWQLFAVNRDGGNRVQLTHGELASFYPATLPDGRIGFVRDGEVWAMNADGGDIRNVSHTTAFYEMAAAWQ